MEPFDDTTQSRPGGDPSVEDGAGTSGMGTAGLGGTTGPAGESSAGDEWQDADAGGGRREQAQRTREAAQQWLGQLQTMIDNVGRQAGPVLRDVAAKAAELAAVAAENAGPVAHKAADVTEQVGVRVAARSKVLAADLRRQAGEGKPDATGDNDGEGTGDTGASI